MTANTDNTLVYTMSEATLGSNGTVKAVTLSMGDPQADEELDENTTIEITSSAHYGRYTIKFPSDGYVYPNDKYQHGHGIISCYQNNLSGYVAVQDEIEPESQTVIKFDTTNWSNYNNQQPSFKISTYSAGHSVQKYLEIKTLGLLLVLTKRGSYQDYEVSIRTIDERWKELPVSLNFIFKDLNLPQDPEERLDIYSHSHESSDSISYRYIGIWGDDKLLGVRDLGYIVKLNSGESVDILLRAIDENSVSIDLIEPRRYDLYDHITEVYDKGGHTELNNINCLRKYNFPPGIDTFSHPLKPIGNDSNSIGIDNGAEYNYSYLMWYYWDEGLINTYLTDGSINDFNGPFLGFNDEFGSFLYAYYLKGTNFYLVMAGSNQYHHIDVYTISDASALSGINGLLPWQHVKINRWFNQIYFVYKKKLFTADINVDNLILQDRKYVQYDSSILDGLEYDIRVLSSPTSLVPISENGEEVYNPEFSDLGDVVIVKKNDEYSLFGVCAHDLDSGDVDNNQFVEVSVNNQTNILPILNPYTIDKNTADEQNRLRILQSMYTLSVEHIKYLEAHGYEVKYVGSKYTIGQKQDSDQLLILGKAWGDSSRIRLKEPKGLYSISDDYLVTKSGNTYSYRSILDDTHDTLASNFIAWDRHTVIGESGPDLPGCYRRRSLNDGTVTTAKRKSTRRTKKSN